jgi:hypothetical protein
VADGYAGGTIDPDLFSHSDYGTAYRNGLSEGRTARIDEELIARSGGPRGSGEVGYPFPAGEQVYHRGGGQSGTFVRASGDPTAGYVSFHSEHGVQPELREVSIHLLDAVPAVDYVLPSPSTLEHAGTLLRSTARGGIGRQVQITPMYQAGDLSPEERHLRAHLALSPLGLISEADRAGDGAAVLTRPPGRLGSAGRVVSPPHRSATELGTSSDTLLPYYSCSRSCFSSCLVTFWGSFGMPPRSRNCLWVGFFTWTTAPLVTTYISGWSSTLMK